MNGPATEKSEKTGASLQPASTVDTTHDVPDRIPGFHGLNMLVNATSTRIYRGTRSSDDTPVILKVIREEGRNRETLARQQHEHDLLASISSQFVIRTYGLTESDTGPVQVMEDIGGESLDRLYQDQRPDTAELLVILNSLVSGLADIHRAGLIHKDINPANVVFNPGTGELRIIDFGIATRLAQEEVQGARADLVPGTTAYMSPEQTGRMNRLIDYRSDYYALGATLYQLLTGRLMFLASEPIEWFHCHIARRPTPPAELVRGVPVALSNLTMKLLEKNAENRYQSAHGILADLEQCQFLLRDGQELAAFPLGRKDIPERFRIPAKLYGREKALRELTRAFDNAYDRMSVALVAGQSGNGKTSLINELYKPITARKSYFIRGKFDQLHRDIPYSGLTVALRDLMRQVLTESPQRIAELRSRLQASLGGNARLMTDMIPELELILGEQPEVEPLAALESEQRFRLTLFSFFRVFSTGEHPLVLVLDDLQWADNSTLRLADLLVDQEEGEHLLVIGAYRDNEITPDHPLVGILAELSKTDTPITAIRVDPLALADVTQMLADTLHAEPGDVAPLAELVLQKTGGNPFFIDEFLQEQYRQGNITFDQHKGNWTWDPEQLDQQQITDNVAELMSRKLQRLSPATNKLMQLAACAGNRFTLDTLALMTQASPQKVAAAARQAIQEGLIRPIRDAWQLTELEQGKVADQALTIEFVFIHDRIQEAAYEQMPLATREKAHWRIGHLLLEACNHKPHDDMLFAIVNHLNLSSRLITTDEQRLEVCQLNLKAGQRARLAASYSIAFGHFQKAIHLYGEGKRIWNSHYDLALALYTNGAETAAYVGDPKAMDRFVETGLEHARTVLERVPFHEVQISTLIARGELAKAISIAKFVLAELGHKYPRKPNQAHVIAGFLRVKQRMRKYNLEQIEALPDMTDPTQMAAIRIGASLGSAAMFAEPKLLPLMVFRGIQITLDYGHSPGGVTCFSVLGSIYASETGDVDLGIALGQLAIRIAQRPERRHVLGRALHLHGSIVQHWKEPLANCLPTLREASRVCMEHGDFEYSIHATNILCEYAYHCSSDLEYVQEQVSADLARFRSLQLSHLLMHQASRLQMILNLRGLNDHPEKLSGQAYDIDDMLPRHEVTRDGPLIDYVKLKRLYLEYLFETDIHTTEDKAHLARSMSNVRGFFGANWSWYLCGLAYLREAANTTRDQRLKLMPNINRHIRMVRNLAERSPGNFSNKYQLLVAEKLRLTGKPFEAHSAYDRAIELSRQIGFLNEEALANELCGTMHLDAGRNTLGEPYLRRARQLYHRWGAVAKVRHMEKKYPQLAVDSPVATAGGTTVTSLDVVDVTSLMKALKAIANEQIHSRMVSAVISTAIEFAGAQRGVLALRDAKQNLCIEAEMDVDGKEPTILQSKPVDTYPMACRQVLNYVARTREGLVIDDALSGSGKLPGLNMDPYIQRHQVRSVLCLPIIASSADEEELIGLLYLENNHLSHCFTASRFGALEIIGMSAAGRLELSRKATVDGLTNLFNHEYFQNILRQEMAGVHRYQKELSLLLIDIDHFKRFNDTWGHQLGDKVLRDVSDLIRECCRDGDTAARYGGEEMAVILPGAGLDDAMAVGERIRKAIENHNIHANGEQIHITVSLGVAVADHSVTDGAALIKKADTALYESKANGRNQLTVG